MIIKEEAVEIETASGPMTLQIISPNLPSHPQAKFPAVIVFSEIYQVTAPVKRFAQQISSQGYLVACPSSFHEFEPERSHPYPYDGPGTDLGNERKAKKLLANYDDDATKTVDYLMKHPNCNGKIGATGMCLGGHLAFRCAFDPRIRAAQCYFATDIHSESLGSPSPSDSLRRAKEIQGELVMIFGLDDNHVPFEGRTLIRDTLNTAEVRTTFLEVPAAHAFIRDESSKGRFDAALSRICFDFLLDLFDRNLNKDLGPRTGPKAEAEHVC